MTDKFDKYAIVGMAVWPCHILKRISDSAVHIGCTCNIDTFVETVTIQSIFDNELMARMELKDRLESFTKRNNAAIKKAGESAGEKNDHKRN